MKTLLFYSLFLISGLSLNAQWTEYNLPSSINTGDDIYFLSPTVGFMTGRSVGGTSDGYIFKTTNGGNTWTQVKSLIGNSTTPPYKVFSLRAIQFVNSSLGFCVGINWAYGFICKTIDGGNTWDTLTLNNPAITVEFSDVYFLDANTGFCSSDEGHIHKTTDGGNTWTSVHFAGISINDITFINTTTGFAVTYALSNQSRILKTTDGGNTWNTVHVSGNYNIHTISMASASVGYALADGGRLYKTTDGGNTWVESTISGVNGSYGIYAVSPSIVYASCLSGFTNVLLKSTNGGTSWTTDYSGISMWPVRNYSFLGSTAYAIAVDRYIKTTSAPIGIEESSNDFEISIYPNPSSNFIQLDLPENCEISDVKIYDPSAKLVICKTDEFNQINIENLAKGIYLLNIENDGKIIFSSKFIKE